MTVESTQTRVSYAGDGEVTTFPVPFPFLEQTDLVVILRDANGAEDVAVLDSDYTVAHANVEMEVAPAIGETLLIMRVLPLTQEMDYVEHDAFPAESHETGLDRLTMIVQQLQEQLNRALLLPKSGAFGEPPASADAAGNVGEFCLDADYLYVCVDTDTWKRIALGS
jgi:hypothetical protein